MDVDLGLFGAMNYAMGCLNKERNTQTSNGLLFRFCELIDANHVFGSATVNDDLPTHSHGASGGTLFDRRLAFLPAMALSGSNPS